jgi:hypothetical protein
MERVLTDPPQTDDESQTLNEIGQRQVIHENDVLVISDVAFVILLPENETISEKGK